MQEFNHPILSTKFRLPNGQKTPNRIVKAAMSEGLATPRNGVSSELIELYSQWATAGCGLLITGNIQVDRNHLERAGNVVFDEQMTREECDLASTWAETAQANGSLLWAQLSHAGRQTPKILNPHPQSASSIGVKLPGSGYGEPVAMANADIERAIERFVCASAIAQSVGFAGVQVHAAHGYLINQFLSPLSNTRDDKWGGSLENRARFLLEVVRRIRRAVGPQFAIGVKLNSSDFQKGGFDLEDAVDVALRLQGEGIDLLELSGGTYESPAMASGEAGTIGSGFESLARSSAAREAYFLDYAAKIRESVSVPILVTGGFRTAAGMAAAIEASATDLVGIGRPLATDPNCSAQLLSGEADALPAKEKELRLARPRFLGPNSPVRSIKGLNTLAILNWHCLQLLRHGRKRSPDTKISALSGMIRFSRHEKAIIQRWKSQKG